jgi:hypothetical protein
VPRRSTSADGNRINSERPSGQLSFDFDGVAAKKDDSIVASIHSSAQGLTV